ncbi:hypothetical protein [Methylobacterium goesingense]|uniref:Uncharacterized protein n=1 Tax=Methylobacterium goesingense TaxID=243690 RepID=A0ABV2LB72_9HYPH|nr:hypothetical protein [Methylobacterium goesingense]GJD75293.1 hypothetical protein CFIICLFH_3534 [Methylobacterium goesingense]
MNAIAERRAPACAPWKSLPLEILVSAFAIILAGGLKWAGALP